MDPLMHYGLAVHRMGERPPVLVMCGRHDPQHPPDCVRAPAAGLPDARLVWFAHSGHYPHIEEPAAFSDALASFLNTNPDTPPVAPCRHSRPRRSGSCGWRSSWL